MILCLFIYYFIYLVVRLTLRLSSLTSVWLRMLYCVTAERQVLTELRKPLRVHDATIAANCGALPTVVATCLSVYSVDFIAFSSHSRIHAERRWRRCNSL